MRILVTSLRRSRRITLLYWLQWFATMGTQAASVQRGPGKMPIKMWVPFPTQHSPWYEIGFLWNTGLCIFISGIAALIDTLFFNLVVYLTTRFELLNRAFRQLPPGSAETREEKKHEFNLEKNMTDDFKGMLTEAHKETRKTVRSELLDKYENVGDEFPARIVTGDETWLQDFGRR
ncbi:uncharacterized protein [Periplaneta americana]|uniref:uncharacterized protein n=1 Tax=Periplaneta americana TaxID=6978 RepID=UPI0037E7611D